MSRPLMPKRCWWTVRPCTKPRRPEMCWEGIASSRRRMRRMYVRCSLRRASGRDAIPIPLRLFVPVGTPNAWHVRGLLSERPAAILVHKSAASVCCVFTLLVQGVDALTDILTPTVLDQLVARSRKLGADRSVCNWGGGNTSAKADEVDFRGRQARVLWVKGSGSDLASVTDASFTGLYLDDVLPLLERERMSDTEMVDYLAHCFYEPGRPRPSIETLLHGFLPFAHIDHTHADATNYFACAEGGEAHARDCFGDALIWIPYRRPGFGLAREVALALRAKPHATLVILAKHGLITWGESDESCYASTMATITQARTYVEARIARADKALFGGFRVTPLDADERRSVAAQVAPVMRGLVSAEKHQILRFEESEDVLAFASSQDAPRLTKVGAACPDHLVHTKPWPLLVDWTPEQDVHALPEALRAGVEAYVAKYHHYLEANAQQDL